MAKTSTRIKHSKSDRIFNFINVGLVLLISFIVVYPLYFTIIASFSDPTSVAIGEVYLFPKGFTLDSYKNVFADERIWTGYRNTIFYTIAGTTYNIVLTIPAAYVLSKKDLPFKQAISWFFFFTMYFGGGLIPTYLLYSDLGLVNTRWALVLGPGVSCYNMIVSRQFFNSSIPDELYEAAHIDGASQLGAFFKIAIPLSLPIIAVMSLYYGVGHWNSYFSALIYINDANLNPLQLVLRNILILNQNAAIGLEFDDDALQVALEKQRIAEAMKYSTIFIASAPLLAIYPFIQKFFVKGVMVGSVKG